MSVAPLTIQETVRRIAHDYQRFVGRQITWIGFMGLFFREMGFKAVTLYRIGRYLTMHRFPVIPFLLKRKMLVGCHCQISFEANIAEGFVIRHVGDIVVGKRTVIGQNCEIRQGVTLGGNFNKSENGRTQPVLGDYVQVGAGAKILGPVMIGSGSIIGSNAVVVHNVDENQTVAGVPARPIGKKTTAGTSL